MLKLEHLLDISPNENSFHSKRISINVLQLCMRLVGRHFVLSSFYTEHILKSVFTLRFKLLEVLSWKWIGFFAKIASSSYKLKRFLPRLVLVIANYILEVNGSNQLCKWTLFNSCNCISYYALNDWEKFVSNLVLWQKRIFDKWP